MGSSPSQLKAKGFRVVPLCFLAFLAWLGYGRSRVELPSLVITALTFSNENSGSPGVLPKLYAGIEAAI